MKRRIKRLRADYGLSRCKCGCGSWWFGGLRTYIVRERGTEYDRWLRLVFRGRIIWERLA